MQILFVVIAVSIDSFLAALAYGNHHIKLSIFKILVISFICTCVLGISLLLSQFISLFLNKELCMILSSILFFGIGITTLFQTSMKTYLKKANLKHVSFKTNEISFVINIYIDETCADKDHSKDISLIEAIYLSTALSLDSLFSGLAIGISNHQHVLILVLTFLFTCVSFISGYTIGKHLSKSNLSLSWLTGLLFIILGFSKFMR